MIVTYLVLYDDSYATCLSVVLDTSSYMINDDGRGSLMQWVICFTSDLAEQTTSRSFRFLPLPCIVGKVRTQHEKTGALLSGGYLWERRQQVSYRGTYFSDKCYYRGISDQPMATAANDYFFFGTDIIVEEGTTN